MTLQLIGILIVFVVIVYLMIRGKLTFVIALPLMAVGIALVAGVPFKGDDGIMKVIFDGGVTKMAGSYIALLISAWLGAMMNNTGISKTIIKTAAELGGDKPFLVSVFLFIASALIYTTISGLGGVIMIGQIALPIMISVGVPGLVAGAIFLFSYATGIILNIANWSYFSSLTGVPLADVQTFAYISCGLTALAALAFVIINFRKEGIKIGWTKQEGSSEAAPAEEFQKAHLIPCLTPLVPILLVVAFKWTIITALFAGIVYCFVTTLIFSKGYGISRLLGLTTKSSIDGVNDGALGMLSMIVIGMLTASLSHPVVAGLIGGVVGGLVPTSRILYVALFGLLSFLALYRGPLNVWGVGAGVATLMTQANLIPGAAVMTGFIGCERMQILGDPTNSHSVWISNYVGSDTISLLKKVFIYVYAVCILLAIISSLIYF